MEELLVRPDIAGAWGTPVRTLQAFAERILQDADPGAAPLNDLERRLVLQEALRRLRAAGELDGAGPGSQTDGFLRHLLSVFERLKQAAVEPDEFTERVRRRKHPAALDLVVARAYQEYQAALIERGAYDRIGVYWQARQLLEAPHGVPLLQGISLVAFDGFDDFTESEFRLIAALGNRVNRLVFAVRADGAAGGADLYRLQRQTLARIETAFQPSMEWLPARPPATYSEHASTCLLWRDEKPSVDGLVPNLEVVPCAGVTDEVEMIGRAVKTLILDGVPAAEIAIVYADLGAVREALRSMGREFQIPLRLYGGEPLAASSVCAFVLDALEASGAWQLAPGADEARKGFLLNHLITEELPFAGGHISNSDPVTGQAGWYDVRVNLRPAEPEEAAESFPQVRAVPSVPGLLSGGRRVMSYILSSKP